MGGSIQDIVIAVATPGTAVPLSATSRRVGMLSLMAKKATGDNTGTVHLGISSVDKTTRQIISMLPGDYWEPQLEQGGGVDLADIFVDADTAADGVTGLLQGV